LEDVRASRLVSILLLLQNKGRITAQELADELEVSVRTIYRDMDSLADAGVPLYGEAGHDGGYRLVDGYRTRLTGLTVGEAESLFLTGLPTAAADLGLGASVTAAQLKLMAALPEELRDRAGRVAERFHLDAPSWYRDPDTTPHLGVVAEAVWTQRAIRIRYLRWDEPQEITRVIEPYGLVLKAGRWYLVAAADHTTRTYRVSRILDVQSLDITFERDAGFDLASYWQQSLKSFEERRHVDHAVLRLSPDALERLLDVAAPIVVDAARRTAEPDEAGRLRVTIPVEAPDQAISELLRLAPDVEVLAPHSLRQLMIETLQSLTRLYITHRPIGTGGTAKPTDDLMSRAIFAEIDIARR
jgi:predicted DNA-binding transcriptional regulator YafY